MESSHPTDEGWVGRSDVKTFPGRSVQNRIDWCDISAELSGMSHWGCQQSLCSCPADISMGHPGAAAHAPITHRGTELSTIGRWEYSAYSLEKVPPEKGQQRTQRYHRFAGEGLHSSFPKWDRIILYLVAKKT